VRVALQPLAGVPLGRCSQTQRLGLRRMSRRAPYIPVVRRTFSDARRDKEEEQPPPLQSPHNKSVLTKVQPLYSPSSPSSISWTFMPAACGAMGTAVALSNYLVQFPVGWIGTWGTAMFPVCFLITNLTNRFAGAAAARRVV
jgi:hypothetical protein